MTQEQIKDAVKSCQGRPIAEVLKLFTSGQFNADDISSLAEFYSCDRNIYAVAKCLSSSNYAKMFEDDEEQPDESCESEDETDEDTENPTENEESKAETKEDKLNPYEKAILDEMNRRASGEDGDMPDDILTKGMQSSDKNIHACYNYVVFKARKQAVGNCAMIEDSVVYSWAHHYYIESKETIDEEMKPKATAKPKAEKKPAPKKEVEKETKKADTKKKDKIASNPLLKAVSKKKTQKDNGGEIVTEVKKGGKVFTITEFTLF